MSNDKPKFGNTALVIFILGAISYGTVLAVQPKHPASDASEQPRQTVSSPEPGSRVRVGGPELPKSSGINIYLVNQRISPRWDIDAAMEAWHPAKWTEFKLVKECPVAEPCVRISEKKLQGLTAGETLFTNQSVIFIHLDPKVRLASEAHNTLAHELGHVLGLGHIKGTTNSVMPARGVFKTRPTPLDIQMADRLGPWNAEKMYRNSGIDVDASQLPK